MLLREILELPKHRDSLLRSEPFQIDSAEGFEKRLGELREEAVL